MRHVGKALFCAAAWLAASGGPAAGQQDARTISQIIAADGLSAADEALAKRPATPENSFLRGGVRFLLAQEAILQIRYANYSGRLRIVPGMRFELPPNPDGRFDPAFVEQSLTAALANLADARKALAEAVDGEFQTELSLGGLWFDVNQNGARDEWESLAAFAGGLAGLSFPEDADDTVRFDTADAEWLMAYAHALSGVAELVLSVDPTPAIRTVHEGRETMKALGALTPTPFLEDDTVVDLVAAVLTALDGEPDRKRTRRALRHFKSMIDHNQAFWREVALEEDDTREWLPNADQTSAFGMEVDAETAEAWQAVLAEVDAVLDGELLLPYWRVGGRSDAAESVGLNLKRILEDPPNMDVVLWIQGASAAPYLEVGPISRGRSFETFAEVASGGVFTALWLN